MPRTVVAVVRESAPSDQAAAVVKWAAAHDAEVIRTVGASLADLSDVLVDVRAGVVSGLVVRSLADLGDIVHQEATRAAVEREGGDLHVVAPATTSEEIRDLLQRFDDVRTELDKRVRGAQMRRGADRVREEQGRSGGRAAFGMKLVAGQWVEDAREMAIRTRILELWDSGAWNYTSIARQMKTEGYLTKDGKSEWYADTIRRIVLRAKKTG